MRKSKGNSEPSEAIVPNLLSIIRSMRALHGIQLGSLGFHNGQDELLLALNSAGKTVSKVADELSVRSSTISKMVDRLEERGLAERLSDKDDRRKTLVRITPVGEAACAAIREAHEQLDRDFMKSLAQERLTMILASLDDVSSMLATRLSRHR